MYCLFNQVCDFYSSADDKFVVKKRAKAEKKINDQIGRVDWPDQKRFYFLNWHSIQIAQKMVFESARKKNEFTSNLIDTHMLARVNDTSIKLDECQLLFSSCCEYTQSADKYSYLCYNTLLTERSSMRAVFIVFDFNIWNNLCFLCFWFLNSIQSIPIQIKSILSLRTITEQSIHNRIASCSRRRNWVTLADDRVTMLACHSIYVALNH